jgi:hypothetical protein
MATKPVTLPEWASDAAADVVIPSAGKKLLGWIKGERPPAQYFNWWQELVYNWIQYLDDLAAQNFAWTATHSFAASTTLPADTFMHYGTREEAVLALTHVDGVNWTQDIPNGWATCTLAGDLAVPLRLATGERLKTVTYRRRGNTTVDVDAYVKVIDGTTGAVSVINSGGVHFDDDNIAAAWGNVTLDVTDTTMDAGDAAYLMLSSNAGGAALLVSTVSYTYDRP